MIFTLILILPSVNDSYTTFISTADALGVGTQGLAHYSVAL